MDHRRTVIWSSSHTDDYERDFHISSFHSLLFSGPITNLSQICTMAVEVIWFQMGC